MTNNTFYLENSFFCLDKAPAHMQEIRLVSSHLKQHVKEMVGLMSHDTHLGPLAWRQRPLLWSGNLSSGNLETWVSECRLQGVRVALRDSVSLRKITEQGERHRDAGRREVKGHEKNASMCLWLHICIWYIILCFHRALRSIFAIYLDTSKFPICICKYLLLDTSAHLQYN